MHEFVYPDIGRPTVDLKTYASAEIIMHIKIMACKFADFVQCYLGNGLYTRFLVKSDYIKWETLGIVQTAYFLILFFVVTGPGQWLCPVIECNDP